MVQHINCGHCLYKYLFYFINFFLSLPIKIDLGRYITPLVTNSLANNEKRPNWRWVNTHVWGAYIAPFVVTRDH